MKTRTFRIFWSAAAASVILTGAAQSIAAQGTAIISATVRNAVTGNPVADSTGMNGRTVYAPAHVSIAAGQSVGSTRSRAS